MNNTHSHFFAVICLASTPRRINYLPYWLILSLLILTLLLPWQKASAGTNGFDLSDTSVPADQIYHGGPPRDGIPALTNPLFISAEEANFLSPDSRLIGVNIKGAAKAYPISILNYHEIVNDEIAGQRIAVTFCPLCGTGIVYDAYLDGEFLEFGVSGLLYNSDVLLYDRQTESLWSQVMSTAVSGPKKGQKLRRIAAQHTDWKTWQVTHPDTKVLSQRTGHAREYQRTPYAGYNESGRVFFPVANQDSRYHNKEVVITLELNGKTKAYPFSELALQAKNSGSDRITDVVAEQPIVIEFNLQARSGRILDAQNNEIPSFSAFWFAWIAFHPDTEVYSAAE